MNEAERIVLLLAALDEPLLDGTYANGVDLCALCSGNPGDHDEDCPWQMAKEWAARYEAATGPVIPFETVPDGGT